jgi:iron complex transport system substrate-binding protein
MVRLKVRRWLPLPLAPIAIAIGACSMPLSACSGTHVQNAAQGAAGTASATSFPLKLAAADGAVTIPHEPRRIVSLSATGTEDLYAIGAGAQVIAVDSYSTYPPQAPRTKLSEFSPNVEAIARYRPDLVVVAEDTDHVVSQLQKLGVPALLEPPASSLAAAYGEMRQIGEATGHAAAAARVVHQIRSELAAIVRSLPRPRRRLRVYHELEPTFYSATSHTFVGQVYAMLGLDNVADAAHVSGSYPQLSAEYVIASDPDLIVLADTVCCKQSAATVAARPGWRDIAAVRSGAIVPVEDAIASQWGPRIVLFARRVAEAVRRLEAASR